MGTSTALPAVGDRVVARHHCHGADVLHVAASGPVLRVVELGVAAAHRVETSRCDGTGMHVIVRVVDGDLVDVENDMVVDVVRAVKAVSA